MKILMLCEGMDIGGCETHVYELTLALIEQGHTVLLVCAGGRFAKKLEKRGVRTVVLPTKGRDPISLLRTARGLRRLAREEAFDVVHVHTRGMARLARSILPLPLCVTVHLNFKTNPLLRRLCHFGEATLVVSEDIKEYLVREYHAASERISLTYNGVNLDLFKPSENARGIVHLSRLDKDRSLCALLLCKIAPQLLCEHRDLRIHMFGDGNDLSRVKRAAQVANEALGFEGVVLHGATTDLPNALAFGDIFVGASRAAIEAMASRHATIVAGNDGYGGIVSAQNLPSLLATNFCARGMPIANAERLRHDLCHLLRNEEARVECAHLCRATAEMHYAREGMAKDAMDAYRASVFRYKKRATLIGYYGYGNFGDAMTLRVLCEILPYHKLIVPCAMGHAEDLPKAKGKEIQYTGRFFGMLFAILRSKEVVFGGGTLFQNTTSTRSLLYYSFVAFFAHLLGRRLRMIAGGVERIRGRIPRFIAQGALRRFDAISVRTGLDQENLHDLIRKDCIQHLPDAVFLHSPKEERMHERAVLILNASYKHPGLSDLISRLRKLQLTPILVVLFPREDGQLALKISRTYGIEIFPYKEPDSVFALVSSGALCICERLHGAIASLLVRRPCFLRASSEKVKGLIEDVRRACDEFNTASPIHSFYDYSELTEKRIEEGKKEAAGKSYGFDQIIQFFRECWKERFTPLLRELPQQRELLQRQLQRQPSPWEPSS